MRRSKSEARCKKHPNHRLSPGVCSFCLRERLSQLSSSSKGAITTSCSSSTSCSSCSSYYSSPSYSSGSASSSPSSSSSPAHYLSSTRKSRILFGMFGRSRSVAAVGGRMKKGGFWSRLLRSSGMGRKEGHSFHITMNEMPSGSAGRE